MQDANPLPRIVVIGAGFGGLEAVKALAAAPADVTLIDQRNYHCFQPLLYQVATAALSAVDIAWPIRSILSRQANVRVAMTKVTGIDHPSREVLTADGRFAFDFLVIATGATHSYFGHAQWAQFAPSLKSIDDALRIRANILTAFEKAELAKRQEEVARLLTFVIVGGGPTGVEMAGAIAEIARFVLRRDFRNVNPRDARIILAEAGPRILPALPDSLARYAERRLGSLGVEVLTSSLVTGCDEGGVVLGEKARIAASTIVWAAGVKASAAGNWLGAPSDRLGRIEVAADLSVPGFQGIYAIGDVATIKDQAGRPVPGIAPAAKQMGRYVAKQILSQIRGRPRAGMFRYRHYGDLATIGRNAAIVALGRIRLIGFAGWVFWSAAHIYFLIGVRNRFIVAFNWMWDYITFRRGARVIIQERGLTAPGQLPDG